MNATPVVNYAMRGEGWNTTRRGSLADVRSKRTREPWYVGLLITVILTAALAGLATLTFHVDGSGDAGNVARPMATYRYGSTFFDWFTLIGILVAPIFLLFYYVRWVWFHLVCLIACGFGAWAVYDELTSGEGILFASLGLALMFVFCLAVMVIIALGAIIGHGMALIARHRQRTFDDSPET
jgi:hypothetical protein